MILNEKKNSIQIHINKPVNVYGSNTKTYCPDVYTVQTFSLAFYRSICECRPMTFARTPCTSVTMCQQNEFVPSFTHLDLYLINRWMFHLENLLSLLQWTCTVTFHAMSFTFTGLWRAQLWSLYICARSTLPDRKKVRLCRQSPRWQINKISTFVSTHGRTAQW